MSQQKNSTPSFDLINYIRMVKLFLHIYSSNKSLYITECRALVNFLLRIAIQKSSKGVKHSNKNVKYILDGYKELKDEFIKSFPNNFNLSYEEIEYTYFNSNNTIESLSLLENKLKLIESRIGFLPPIEKLPYLYRHFHKSGNIKCNFDEFKLHFTHETPIYEKMIWLSSANELAYVFQQLMYGKVIPYNSKIIKLIDEHFCKKNGTGFNVESLRTMSSRRPQILIRDSINKTINYINK